MKKNRLCSVTSSRAEYDLLRNILLKLKENNQIDLRMLVTGTHLKKKFGLSKNYIIKDGFRNISQIDIMYNKNNLPQSTSMSISKGIGKFTKFYIDNKINYLIVLGDRFEIFSAVTAAYVLGIKIIHFSGGDTSLGSLDNTFRHSISLMSSMHFVKLKEHKRKLIQLGIEKKNIEAIGSLSLENYKNYNKLSLDNVNEKLRISLKKPYAVISFHPVTIKSNVNDNNIKLFLDSLLQEPNLNYICTASNIDAGGIYFNKMFTKYSKKYPERFFFIENLGKDLYFSLLSQANAMIGNSSSGIIESTMFKLPAINILPRQEGRMHNKNVIDIKNDKKEILRALKRIKSNKFKNVCKSSLNIFLPKDINNLSKNLVRKIIIKIKETNE